MDPDSVDAVEALIRDHPIFRNKSTCPQESVRTQLLVTLYYFGAEGSGGSRIRSSGNLGIGEGTILKFMSRIVTAILSHEKAFVRWPRPDSEEYHRIIEKHLYLHGFPNCVGFVDGTHFALYKKPLKSGDTYWTRHDEYALNGTFVVDADARILKMAIGCMF